MDARRVRTRFMLRFVTSRTREELHVSTTVTTEEVQVPRVQITHVTGRQSSSSPPVNISAHVRTGTSVMVSWYVRGERRPLQKRPISISTTSLPPLGRNEVLEPPRTSNCSLRTAGRHRWRLGGCRRSSWRVRIRNRTRLRLLYHRRLGG